MKQPIRETWNEDGSYSLLLYDKEVIRGEYEDVDKKCSEIAEVVGTTLGIGFGAGVGLLAAAVNPFLVLLLPAEMIAISLFLLRKKTKESDNE